MDARASSRKGVCAHGIRRPNRRGKRQDNRNQGGYAPGGHTQQIEVSFQGSGRLLGHDITDIGTYVQTLRPGGVLYGEGDVFYITADGESAQWRGFGVGRPTGPFPAGHFAVCGSIETESRALRRLNEIATVAEYDVDQEGNYHYTTWRWH
jgi:hypothetical protein